MLRRRNHSVASDLDLHCLPQKWDAMQKWAWLDTTAIAKTSCLQKSRNIKQTVSNWEKLISEENLDKSDITLKNLQHLASE